ncbi:3-hydroxyisobutyrate dehydrogenase-like protein [Variovorax paradoxus B4]|nr:NAD(P)-dependent oxidoreductase [Variovorax paradoxus]AGU50501.1 3-hydroxyisobutyrate dehydrogenase-like protein [Variovorax paradoxus B4]
MSDVPSGCAVRAGAYFAAKPKALRSAGRRCDLSSRNPVHIVFRAMPVTAADRHAASRGHRSSGGGPGLRQDRLECFQFLAASAWIHCRKAATEDRTMDPGYVRALEGRLAQHSIWLVDAPVTGGAIGAERGQLTIMGSGKRGAVELAPPVLETFGNRVRYLGAAGCGAQMKILNQVLCGVHLAAAGEPLALARRQGLPLDLTLEILCSGAAGSWMLADRGPRMIAGKFDDITSAVDIFVKDMSLVLDATRESRFPAALAHAAYLAFLGTAARGLGAQDDSAVTTAYEVATKS